MGKIYKGTIILLFIVFSNVNIIAQCDSILLWEDDFNGNYLNQDLWNIEIDNSGGGNNELQYYTDRDTNIFVKDGFLHLRALKEAYFDKSYTSAKITSKFKGDFKYVYIESSMKMPKGKGFWPALWMLPTKSKFGGWPQSGEIDIVELIGQEPEKAYGTLHYGNPWAYTNGIVTLDQDDFSKDFHKFAIEWKADTIKWLVDDEVYSTKTKADLESENFWKIFQEDFFIIFNLAVGGDWPGEPDETSVFPQEFVIDYIRVYGSPKDQTIFQHDTAYFNSMNCLFTFLDIPGADYEWLLPEGSTLQKNDKNKINVNWGCIPGDIKLVIKGLGCSDSILMELPVVFSTPKIVGEELVLTMEELEYRTQLLSNTTYTWIIPNEAEFIEEIGDSIKLIWGCNPGNVYLTIENNCGQIYDSLMVGIKEPKLLGQNIVSEYSDNILYSIEDIRSTSFFWEVPNDAEITDGQVTSTISVDFGQEGGEITVELTNPCGTNVYSLPVNISNIYTLADFESTFMDFTVFAESLFNVVDNNKKDSINPSNHVASTYKSHISWAGIFSDLGFNIDLDDFSSFQLKVYGPKSGKVLFKLEDNDEKIYEPVSIEQTLTTPFTWEILEFELPDASLSGIFDRIALFFDFGSNDTNTYLFDDLTFIPRSNNSALERISNYKEIKIFPVPASNFINIYQNGISGDEDSSHIKIFDIHGELVYSSWVHNNDIIRISTDSFSSGIYLLDIHNSKNNYSGLFIINN